MPARTPDEINTDKRFAAPYKEEYEVIDPEEITKWMLQKKTVDMTYATHSGTKTVRCSFATTPSEWNDIPDGCVSFQAPETKYYYHIEEQQLISVNRTGHNRTVASGDDFCRFELVQYPERAPVKGAVEDDVEATIYYRSPRSDKMQSVTITVDSRENHAVLITGDEVGGDRRIEALTRYERTLKKGWKGDKLGKVARVEFPKGHRFTVEVEGLKNSDTGRDTEDRISRVVKAKLRGEDLSVSVSHDGQLEWEDS